MTDTIIYFYLFRGIRRATRRRSKISRNKLWNLFWLALIIHLIVGLQSHSSPSGLLVVVMDISESIISGDIWLEMFKLESSVHFTMRLHFIYLHHPSEGGPRAPESPVAENTLIRKICLIHKQFQGRQLRGQTPIIITWWTQRNERTAKWSANESRDWMWTC